MSIKVTTDVVDKLCKGYLKFYKIKSPKPTLRNAYEQTLVYFFTADYEIHNGQRCVILPPRETSPSFG